MTPVVKFSKATFLLGGIYAVACIPAIFLAERFGWNQRPFHLTQTIALVLCFVASTAFLWCTRASRFDALRWLATAAVVLCGLWIAFLAFVLATFDLSAID